MLRRVRSLILTASIAILFMSSSVLANQGTNLGLIGQVNLVNIDAGQSVTEILADLRRIQARFAQDNRQLVQLFADELRSSIHLLERALTERQSSLFRDLTEQQQGAIRRVLTAVTEVERVGQSVAVSWIGVIREAEGALTFSGPPNEAVLRFGPFIVVQGAGLRSQVIEGANFDRVPVPELRIAGEVVRSITRPEVGRYEFMIPDETIRAWEESGRSRRVPVELTFSSAQAGQASRTPYVSSLYFVPRQFGTASLEQFRTVKRDPERVVVPAQWVIRDEPNLNRIGRFDPRFPNEFWFAVSARRFNIDGVNAYTLCVNLPRDHRPIPNSAALRQTWHGNHPPHGQSARIERNPGSDRFRLCARFEHDGAHVPADAVIQARYEISYQIELPDSVEPIGFPEQRPLQWGRTLRWSLDPNASFWRMVVSYGLLGGLMDQEDLVTGTLREGNADREWGIVSTLPAPLAEVVLRPPVHPLQRPSNPALR